MTTEKHWNVEIVIDEHDDRTRAEARLVSKDRTQLTGVGKARKNPTDTNVPRIGDELAAARALSELAHHLLHNASDDIETITHKPVHLDV